MDGTSQAAVDRWSQVDPLNQFQHPREANRYVYAGGDPINLSDPSGLSQGCATSYPSQREECIARFGGPRRGSVKPSLVLGGISASCGAVALASSPAVATGVGSALPAGAGVCSSVTGIVGFGFSLFGL